MICLGKCGRQSTFLTSQESRKHWTVSAQLSLPTIPLREKPKETSSLSRLPILGQVPLIAVDNLISTASHCSPAMLLWPAPCSHVFRQMWVLCFPLPLASFEWPRLGSSAGPSPAGMTKNTVQLPVMATLNGNWIPFLPSFTSYFNFSKLQLQKSCLQQPSIF